MLTYELRDHRGFDVIHNSTSWRIALHAYDSEVNGLESLQNWGFHRDSQEGFVLLKGAAWLLVLEESGDDQVGTEETADGWKLYHLEPERLYVVQPGEGHAIVLKEDSEVLIIENRDMSQSYSRAIRQDVQMAVKKEIGGC